ncbi:uncharacterized protein LOC113330806 [Papaver somniferum]|uniref:uncharacterized protein LOC113330806 n=1 Tax=Papaver somniferum TaxID=3469 RepID=UPI000E6F5586|nr:uncharacterized protein LOC113330806 [Papaver somniferum]
MKGWDGRLDGMTDRQNGLADWMESGRQHIWQHGWKLLKVVLPDLISSHQSAFIKKIQNLDGILVANELIDSGERSGKPGLLVKIDFEKAFDHVNWDCLDEIFALMGFGVRWRKWIRCCVEFVRFSVLISGSSSGYFKSKKGIRQGDPLSPFLFLLVGEALSFMIQRALQLVENIEQVKNLRLILLFFEQLIGLKINFAKSTIYGVAYSGDLTQFFSLLGCYSGALPTTYLGLPLGDKSRGVAK